MWLDVSWKFTCSGADSFERPGGSHSKGLWWLHRSPGASLGAFFFSLGSPGWTVSWGDHGSGPCQFGYGHPSEVPWDAATADPHCSSTLPWVHPGPLVLKVSRSDVAMTGELTLMGKVLKVQLVCLQLSAWRVRDGQTCQTQLDGSFTKIH